MRRILGLVACLSCLAVTACGSGSGSEEPAPDIDLPVGASPVLLFGTGRPPYR